VYVLFTWYMAFALLAAAVSNYITVKKIRVIFKTYIFLPGEQYTMGAGANIL